MKVDVSKEEDGRIKLKLNDFEVFCKEKEVPELLAGLKDAISTIEASSPNNRKPCLGQIVHYVIPDWVLNAGQERVGIITDLKEDWNLPEGLAAGYGYFAGVHIFLKDFGDCTVHSMGPLPTGNSCVLDIHCDQTGKPGTWHWAE